MDQEDFVICPYNPTHRIHGSQLLMHINTCRFNYSDKKLKTCPYNKTHILSSMEYEQHLKICTDRGTNQQNLLLPPSEILDESRPSTSRQQPLDSHDETSPIDPFQSFRTWRSPTSELKKTESAELPKIQLTSPIINIDEWLVDNCPEFSLTNPNLETEDIYLLKWPLKKLQLINSPKASNLFRRKISDLAERLEKSLVLESTPDSFSSSGDVPSSAIRMSRKRKSDTKDTITYPSTSTKPDVAKESEYAEVEMKEISSSEYISKKESKLILYHGETIYDFTDDLSNDSHNSQQSGNSQQKGDTKIKKHVKFSSDIDEAKYKRRRK